MAFIKPKPQPTNASLRSEPKRSEKTLLERITELRAECDQRIEEEAARIKERDAPSVPLPVIMQGLLARYRGDSILAVEALDGAK